MLWKRIYWLFKIDKYFRAVDNEMVNKQNGIERVTVKMKNFSTINHNKVKCLFVFSKDYNFAHSF